MKRTPMDSYYAHAGAPDLFRPIPPSAHTDTSFAAALSVADKVHTLRAAVLRKIRLDPDGCTCDQVEQESGMTHQTASARINELHRAGSIYDSGERRKTRQGRSAIVWKVT